MSSVAKDAADFVESYAAAGALGKNFTNVKGSEKELATHMDHCATEMAKHYLANPVLFVQGPEPMMWKSHDEALENLNFTVRRYVSVGAGLDLSLKTYRVEPVSDFGNGVGTAICFITWHLDPWKESGFDPYDWEVVYCYRKFADGRAGWEWVVPDNEMAACQRWPGFFDFSSAQ